MLYHQYTVQQVSKLNQIIKKFPEYWSETDSKPKWIGILVGKSADKELIEKITINHKP